MRRLILAALLALLAAPGACFAQSACPVSTWFAFGYVPTSAEWQSCWNSKQNALGYVPVNKAGDTMLGKLVTLTSSLASAGLNLPLGVAPTSPSAGDIWMTTAGLYTRVSGSTIGPLVSGLSTTLTSAHVFVGNGSNVATDVAVSGDISITNAGAATVGKVNGVSYGASPAVGTVANVSGTNVTTYTATPTLGVAGSTLGSLTLSGNTSGTTVLRPTAAASGTLTLPAATDTLVGKATTDTLTNKTLTSPVLTTPSLGVASATSLSFGGTALSAYVEGTWTPAITTSGTVGTPAYAAQVGSYERIGRQVTARFVISLSGWTGSPSGNVSIAGLPLASANVANDTGTCAVSFYTAAGLASLSYGLAGLISPNSSAVAVFQNGSAGSANLTASQAGTGFVIEGACFYHV